MKTQNELVDDFAASMKEELTANEHKGNWVDWKDVPEIRKELKYHLEKLDNAIEMFEESGRSNMHLLLLIKELIADNGNILLMLGNAYELY